MLTVDTEKRATVAEIVDHPVSERVEVLNHFAVDQDMLVT